MRLLIDHTFWRTSLDRFVEVYFSDAFNDEISPQIGVRERRRLERQDLADGRVRTVTRVVPEARLPAAVRRLLGDVPIVYNEISVYDPRAHVLEYEIDSVARRYLQVAGTIRFLEVPGGVRRLLEGEVSVRVQVVRRLCERTIESALCRAYARKAELMQRYLDQHAAA